MTKTKILSLFIKANKITLSFIIQKVGHFQSQRSSKHLECIWRLKVFFDQVCGDLSQKTHLWHSLPV